ncbi:MAG: hypothetical protein FJ207_04665 [Gemmatimonadetes bacterium]|nr:hypothetical protein [Gemmatimonadota bacterium]
MRRIAVVLALTVLASTQGALAQFAPGARSVGMGGAGMVFSTGVDAIEWNPANLALEGGWNISLGEVGAAALFSGITLDDFRSMVEDDGAASAVVADFPASGLTLATSTEGYLTDRSAEGEDLPRTGSALPTIGLSFGSFGLRVRSRVLNEARMSKELADLIVDGFDPSEMQNYRIGNTGLRTTSFTEITAAYGAMLGDRMAIGVGGRYVQGHKLIETRFFEPVLDLLNETADVTAAAVEAPGGGGYGLDVGLALDLFAGFRVSASATNVIQKMTWDDALVGYEYTYHGCDSGTLGCNSSFDLDPEELLDSLRFSDRTIDPSAMSLPMYQTAQGLYPGAFFPTVYRLGVGWQVGWTTIELVGSSVSPKGREHSQWDDRISLGIEQRLFFLRLRAGGAKGSDGLQVISGGVGLGLGPVNLDVSGGLMSGGFEFAESLVTPEDVDYAGGHVTLSVQIKGGGS